MIRKLEKYYYKEIKTNKILKEYGRQYRRRTIYYLFYIIPIFIKNEIVKGDYEDKR